MIKAGFSPLTIDLFFFLPEKVVFPCAHHVTQQHKEMCFICNLAKYCFVESSRNFVSRFLAILHFVRFKQRIEQVNVNADPHVHDDQVDCDN